MPFTTRFATTTNGAITFTGNTLGLSKQPGTQLAGTDDSIGAFIDSSTAAPILNYPSPPGTTLLYTQNESLANLNIPPGSTVLYAELIWGGTYKSTFSGIDLSGSINNAVNFTTPLGTFAILPDPATANDFDFTLTGGVDAWYMRSADVTTLVQNAGAGAYTTGSVVGTVDPLNDFSNSAGWTLAVVYQNLALPTRNISLFVGAEFVDPGSPPVDTTISGFITPAAGPVNARILVSAQEGDAIFTGDQLLFGPTAATLTALSGPNNPIDNFFASQINDDTGNIDTTGSFGTFNHNAPGATNVFAGRQGWDITNVDGSAVLVNSQTSAVVRLTTAGDRYMPNVFGVQIDVAAPNLQPTKFVDKVFAEVGDTLTYTIVIPNNGDIDADNAVFTDVYPTGTTYVPGSFEVDGSPVAGDPAAGINIGTITAGGSVTVTFEVTVDSQPLPATLINQATMDFEFEGAPGDPPLTGSVTSNQVTTQVEAGQLSVVKSVNKAFVEVGDTLTYTVVVTNTGTVTATNVFFQDIDPPGTSFVPNSVFIDLFGQPGLDPNPGFLLSNLTPGASTTVSFTVDINSVPVPNPTTNIANVTFDFQLGPGEPTQTLTEPSNPVDSTIILGQLDVVKSVDEQFADIGDTLSYTITVSNTGDVAVTSVVLTDLIPNGTSFVTGSVTIDGSPQPTADPALGINLGTILVAGLRTVRFQVTVDQIPVPNPIPDTATVDFDYTVDPGQPPVSTSTTSNTVTTQVNNADITADKSVDKAFADIGDTLTYTITLTNNGSTSADNVVFTDPIPPGTSFVTGSVTVNGFPQPGANPAVGINIGSIPAGGTATIIFQITVDLIPDPNPITDTAAIDYEYIVDPQQPPVVTSTTTNTVTTQVNHADIVPLKSVDKAFAEVGETLTYTISLTNTGNVPASVVFVTDPIPSGTSFVPGSVTVNGIPQPAADPDIGINIASIPAGATFIVSFKVIINAIPVPNPIPDTATVSFQYIVDPGQPPVSITTNTNTVTTQVELAQITLFKSADKAIANIGETVTYSVVISNTGTVDTDNVFFTDPPPPGTSFVPDSLAIDGILQPGADPSVGLNLGTLAPGVFLTITFDVTVDSIPTPNPTINTATVTFEFRIDPAGPTLTRTTPSNPVPLQIVKGALQVIKSVDKDVSNIGDILTYTVVIINTGTVTANNVVFTDQPPEGTSFVTDSLSINNVPQAGEDPSLGVNLGSIAPGGSVTVSFQVTVDFIPCPPELLNTAIVDFEFTVESTRPPFTATAVSNAVITDVGLRIFKQLSVQENLEIPPQKPDVENILDVMVKMETVFTKVKPTPIGESYEGQILTGWKLIVEGVLCQVIEYIALKPGQPVHVAEFEVPFSTFLILPEDYNKEPITVTGLIEDVFVTLLDSRTIFKNVTLLVEAFICQN